MMVPTTGHGSGEFGNGDIVSVRVVKSSWLLARITIYLMILAGFSAVLS